MQDLKKEKKYMLGDKQRLNIGIIGLGNIAHYAYLPRIESSDNISLTAVYDVNQEAALSVCKEFGAKQCKSLSELCSASFVDAVAVCTPPKFHKEALLEAINNNKHVISEKPLADNFEDAKELCEAVRGKQLINMVHFTWRFQKGIRTLIDFVKSGEIGDVQHVMVRCSAFNKYDTQCLPRYNVISKDSWVFGEEGGVTSDLGPHVLDLIMQLAGEVQECDVRSGAFRKDEQPAEDWCIGQMKFSSGASGQFLVSHWFNDWISVFLVGSKKILKYEDYRIFISDKETKSQWERVRGDHEDLNFLEEFYLAIKNQDQGMLPSFRDGFLTNQILR